MRLLPIVGALWLVLTGEALAAGSERKVRVEATPRHVVLGGSEPDTIRLEVSVTDAADKPVPEAQVIVRTTAGKIGDLQRIGAGRFTATLAPPEDRFPQLAVVSVAEVSPVVRGEPPWVATVGVAYSARIELRGSSEPGSRQKVEIGDEVFGPTKVAKDGSFMLPIVVPPGVGFATGVATDDMGNASRAKINLYLPEVSRLHGFMYPDVSIADGADRGWLFVTTVDSTGAPVQQTVQASGSRGQISAPESLGPGLTRRAYRAPAEVGDGSDVVHLAISGSPAKADVSLRLMAGPPDSLSITTDPPDAVADGKTAVRVRLQVKDRLGNPADGHDVRVDTGSEVARTERTGPGAYEVVLPARARTASLELPVAVVPRTEECPRPWAGKAPDGTLRIRDIRGILCKLGFAALGPDGAVVLQGHTSELGELVLPPSLPPWEARLAVEGVGGGAPDVLWAGPDKVIEPVPILHGVARVVFRLPAPVTLRLRLVERKGNRVVLDLDVPGMAADDQAQRIAIQSTWGSPEVKGSDGSARIVIDGGKAAGGRLDVVATDRGTGVSAWLRVD